MKNNINFWGKNAKKTVKVYIRTYDPYHSKKHRGKNIELDEITAWILVNEKLPKNWFLRVLVKNKLASKSHFLYSSNNLKRPFPQLFCRLNPRLLRFLIPVYAKCWKHKKIWPLTLIINLKSENELNQDILI